MLEPTKIPNFSHHILKANGTIARNIRLVRGELTSYQLTNDLQEIISAQGQGFVSFFDTFLLSFIGFGPGAFGLGRQTPNKAFGNQFRTVVFIVCWPNILSNSLRAG